MTPTLVYSSGASVAPLELASSHLLGKAKVEHFDAALIGHHDVGGLQVAMDDALVMGGGQRLGDRAGDFQDAIDGETAFRNELIERLALDQFHREEVDAIGFLNRVDE